MGIEGRHTFNQYVVRVPSSHRDALVRHLKTSGIGVEIYYPLSLHQQECFKFLGYQTGDFPMSEEAANTVLALPMFPEITENQQARVVDVCVSYLSHRCAERREKPFLHRPEASSNMLRACEKTSISKARLNSFAETHSKPHLRMVSIFPFCNNL